MHDRLLTVALSVITTLLVVRFTGSPAIAPAPAEAQQAPRELIVDRLIVRKELIVSDTGQPWEAGFEQHEIPRGIVAKSLQRGANGRDAGTAGLWVRGRLIKSDIDDPFDDRFHAINRDGSIFRAPGTSPGTFGLTAAGGKWRSFRARGSSTTRRPARSGAEEITPAGCGFSHSARTTPSR
jgi:hypothetical protein